MTSASPLPSPRPAALRFIFITVLLDMLALGTILPVLPKLVVGFAGGDLSRGAALYGLFATTFALMQFLFSPLMGALSDRYGRRPVILLSNLGLGLDYVLMALAPSLGWLFAGRVIAGITAASIPAASAYVADVSAPEQRAASFGMLSAAFGLGFILGPGLGGLAELSPRLPFWISAGLSLLNAAYGLLVLPESLPKDRRSKRLSWGRANPLGSLRLLGSHRALLGLAAVHFLRMLAHVVLPSTFVLYASHRYGWTEGRVALVLVTVGVASVLVQAGLVRQVVRRVGARRTLLFGMSCGVAGFAVYGLAPTGALFWAGVPLTALWGMSSAALQALMSVRVSPTEQGQLQGANHSLSGLAEMLGPTLFTTTFAAAVGSTGAVQLPGAPFLLAALILAAATGVALAVEKAPA